MQTAPTITPVLAPFSPDTSMIDAVKGGTGDAMKTAAAALALEPVAHTSYDTLCTIGSITLDSTFAALNVVGSVVAFRNCLNGSFISLDGVLFITCSINAVACLDRIVDAAVQVGIGIGSHGLVTSGLVSSVKLVSKLSQGDMLGATVTGAKLVATLALTGHPVVLGIVIAVDLAYSYSHLVLPAPMPWNRTQQMPPLPGGIQEPSTSPLSDGVEEPSTSRLSNAEEGLSMPPLPDAEEGQPTSPLSNVAEGPPRLASS
ncbi:hypothetical protein [Bordetella tumulicola]|uniref:hypothetical protein n=1 Tax=Bordetella tumulicola TaxID=1649133 RepID=UPI0039EECC20